MRGHVVVLRRVWGRHLIHLICLRCNRANASEAKFCSECGAGLLRKFCSRCRAINDAESHFCQSCGEALPAQPSVPHAPTAPPAVVPDLTDVYAEPEEPATAMTRSAPDGRWSDEPTVGVPAVIAESPRNEPVAPIKSHRAVLFGFVGGAALLLAALLWSQGEHGGAPSAEAPAPAMPSVVAPASPEPVAATPAPAQPAVTAASDPTPGTNAAGVVAAVPPAAKEPAKAQERRLAPEALIAAQPPAAGSVPRVAPLERRPTVRSLPPSPPPDCTPEVDALGLCAPGAKVADRSGSR